MTNAAFQSFFEQGFSAGSGLAPVFLHPLFVHDDLWVRMSKTVPQVEFLFYRTS